MGEEGRSKTERKAEQGLDKKKRRTGARQEGQNNNNNRKGSRQGKLRADEQK
jgi:hypothetical protein